MSKIYKNNSMIFYKCLQLLRAGEYEASFSLLHQLDKTHLGPNGFSLLNRIRSQFFESKSFLQSNQNSQEEKNKNIVIVTPVSNGGDFLDNTILSVVNQTGNYILNYHVQDNCSADNTIETLVKWEKILRDKNPLTGKKVNFTWCSEKDSGMYDAIARGFEHINARLDTESVHKSIMTWINSDDILSSNALNTIQLFFQQYPDINFVTGMSSLINESSANAIVYIEPNGFSQQNLAYGLHNGRDFPFVQQEGTFWRYSLWNKCGGLSRQLRLGGDWDLWRRFALHAPLVKIQTVLAMHRKRKGQLSENIEKYYKEIDSIDVRFIDENTKLLKHGLSAIYDANEGNWTITEQKIANKHPLQNTKKNKCLVNFFHRNEKIYSKKELPKLLPSGKPWPKISIVTPSFNQGKYIEETIRSVIDQNYPSLEYIVIDGGSTDETTQILTQYKDFFSYLISEPDRGQSHALNKGFRVASGDIFCWLNSDDQLVPGALYAVAMAFDTHDVDMISGICEIYENGKMINRHISSCTDGQLPLYDLLDLDGGWNSGQFFYQPEVFFTKELWDKAGSYVEEEYFYSMDYELWCRFAFYGAKLHVIGAPLARFRMHPLQKTANPAKFKEELISVQKKFVKEFSIDTPQYKKKEIKWDSVLRIAFINDIGAQYGAGIAHSRLAASVELAGHRIKFFTLKSFVDSYGKLDEKKFLENITDFNPHAIVFGNLHAYDNEFTTPVKYLSERYQTFFVTHDFWLLTGHCAYPGCCKNYLQGCDASCTTMNDYPAISKDKITFSCKKKHDFLMGSSSFHILANSDWSADIFKDFMARHTINYTEKIMKIKLGVETEIFKHQRHTYARDLFGIDSNSFVIAFSASCASDKRKGGGVLCAALTDLGLDNATVLIIGNSYESIDIPGFKIIHTGYIASQELLCTILSAADIFIGPSSEETFGQVFIEAASVGVPSVGFDQTGVANSIINGVTGLRVKFSERALRDAILKLYHDRAYCKLLGQWAKIYAQNEFSLESSFRSFFCSWRYFSLLDNWLLPRKITFKKREDLPVIGTIKKETWVTAKGCSPLEGPYPSQSPPLFNWCYGNESHIYLYSPTVQESDICISLHNPIFDALSISIYFNASHIKQIQLKKSSGFAHKKINIHIHVSMKEHWNLLRLIPDKQCKPTRKEPRPLTFILENIEYL